MAKGLLKKLGALADGRSNPLAPGHARDDDNIIDPGHDLHGKGLGLGHRHGSTPLFFEIPEGTREVTDFDHSYRTGIADDGVSYSIGGGVDGDLFSIDASGQLSFKTAPDWENPLDGGTNAGDNVYEVVVRTSVDGKKGYVEKTVFVTVTDVANPDDPTPGPGAGPQIVAPTETEIEWNTRGALIVDVDAVNPDGPDEEIVYSISGDDADRFVFNAETGEIFAPDISLVEIVDGILTKQIASADGDDYFDVIVTATDNDGSDSIQLSLELYLPG